jgi:hypothetical protein
MNGEQTTEMTGQSTTEVMDKIQTRYGIGRTTAYNRLKFLGISVENSNGRSSLSAEHVDLLDRLNHHISSGNTMESFDRPMPLATYEEAAEIDLAAEGLEFGEVGIDPMQKLVRSAQEQAAGVLIAQSLLAQQYKDNPEALDPDLLAQVEAAQAAIAPKSQDPKQIALGMIRKVRERQSRPTDAEAIAIGETAAA